MRAMKRRSMVNGFLSSAGFMVLPPVSPKVWSTAWIRTEILWLFHYREWKGENLGPRGRLSRPKVVGLPSSGSGIELRQVFVLN